MDEIMAKITPLLTSPKLAHLLLFEQGFYLSSSQVNDYWQSAKLVINRLSQSLYGHNQAQTASKWLTCDKVLKLTLALAVLEQKQLTSKNNFNYNNKSNWQQIVSRPNHRHQQLIEQSGLLSENDCLHYILEDNDTPRAFLAYNPIFKQDILLQWFAIDKSLLKGNDKFYLDYLAQHLPREYVLWQETLFQQGLSPKNFLPFIIHPQFIANDLNKLFREAILEKKIIGPLLKISASPCADPAIYKFQNNSYPFIKITSNAKHNPTPRLHLIEKQNSNCIELRHQPTLSLIHSHLALSVSFINSPKQLTGKQQLYYPLSTLIIQQSAVNKQVNPIKQTALLNFLLAYYQLPYSDFESQLQQNLLSSRLGKKILKGKRTTSPNNICLTFSKGKIENIFIRDC